MTPKVVKKDALTPSQSGALLVIKRLKKELAVPPSLIEIAAELGVNKSTARQYLLILDRKGFIRRTPGKYRSFVIVGRKGGRQ